MAIPLVLCMNANADFVTGVVVGSMLSSGDKSSDQYVQYNPNTTLKCESYSNGWCYSDSILPGSQYYLKDDNSGWIVKKIKVCEVNNDTCVEGTSWYKYDPYKVMNRMGFSKIKSITVTHNLGTFVEFE